MTNFLIRSQKWEMAGNLMHPQARSLSYGLGFAGTQGGQASYLMLIATDKMLCAIEDHPANQSIGYLVVAKPSSDGVPEPRALH